MEKTNVKDIPNEIFFGEYLSKIYSFEELEKEREIREKIISQSF